LFQDSATLTKNKVECEILHVESPSLFWIRLRNNKHGIISENLNDYLRVMTPTSLHSPCQGDYCVAKLENNYERGEIIEIERLSSDVLVKIFLLDVGIIKWYPFNKLAPLPIEFTKFKRQSIPCVLANVIEIRVLI